MIELQNQTQEQSELAHQCQRHTQGPKIVAMTDKCPNEQHSATQKRHEAERQNRPGHERWLLTASFRNSRIRDYFALRCIHRLGCGRCVPKIARCHLGRPIRMIAERINVSWRHWYMSAAL